MFYGTKLTAPLVQPIWAPHGCVHQLIAMVGKSLRGKVNITVHRERICTFDFTQYIYLCGSVLHVNRESLLHVYFYTFLS